jgi:nucleoside-diphosphate-sugar epimerase
MNHIRVAVTSVGSGIGQSIVQSCRFSHLPIYIVGFDINPFAFGAYDCDVQELVPNVSDPGYIPALLEKCRKHDVMILILGLDSELLSVSELKHEFEKEGITVLVADPPFIRLCRDKITWSRELSALTEAVVPCYYFNELDSLIDNNEIHFPLIAKPKGGSGSMGVRIINSLERLRQLDDTFVVQPFIFPSKDDPNYRKLTEAVQNEKFRQIAEVSVQYVISKDQRILGRMASYNKLKDGVPIEIVPLDYNRIWESLEAIFPYLLEKGMKGPVNIQGRLTEEGPRFFEMNGRFTGITGLRAMMGFNEVETLIRDYLDLGSVDSLYINPKRVGMRQVADRSVQPDRYSLLSESLKSQNIFIGHGKKQALLITGSTGWLGRNVVNKLVEQKITDKLFLLVRNRQKAEELFSPIDMTTVKLIEVDNYLNGRWSIGRVDTILHFASGRIPDGPAAIAESLAFTQKLVTDTALFQIPSFINISSQSVYGLSHPPLWVESMAATPDSLYGMSKFATECMVDSLDRYNKSIRATSLRLARLFGPADGMRWDELPHLFARRAVRGEDITIKGGTQRFDLIYIDDAVDALITVLKSDPGIWKSVYNLGSGGSFGIVEIAEQAIGSAQDAGYNGSSVKLIPDTATMAFGMNTELFCHHFNWSPKVGLEEAMRNIVGIAVRELEERKK